MAASDHHVWRWLARLKQGTTPTAIRQANGKLLAGDELVRAAEQHWRSIWPATMGHGTQSRLQQAKRLQESHRQQAQWPAVPGLTGGLLRKAFRKMRGKTHGPDGWRPAELSHAPAQALARAATFLEAIEDGAAWPEPLTMWRQILSKSQERGQRSLVFGRFP